MGSLPSILMKESLLFLEMPRNLSILSLSVDIFAGSPRLLRSVRWGSLGFVSQLSLLTFHVLICFPLLQFLPFGELSNLPLFFSPVLQVLTCFPAPTVGFLILLL